MGTPPSIGIFPGNGDGTFGAEIDSFASTALAISGLSTSSITVGDFNHDGKLDLVVAKSQPLQFDEAQSVVSVILGNGDGTFQAPQSFTWGPGL